MAIIGIKSLFTRVNVGGLIAKVDLVSGDGKTADGTPVQIWDEDGNAKPGVIIYDLPTQKNSEPLIPGEMKSGSIDVD